jgi:predicted nucleic acid-binding protein
MRVAKKVYLDANVLIYYCTGDKKVIECIKYLVANRRKEVLFTSNLSIIQTIAKLQTKRGERKAYSKAQIQSYINFFSEKLTWLNVSDSDIKEAFLLDNKDIEDNIHYIISRKRKCDIIITANKKDFNFTDIIAVLPEKSLIASKIR